MAKFNSEAEMATKVIDWLKEQHWEVYQEVSLGSGGSKVIDIVAVRDGITWAIETKLSLSLALMEQANAHRFRANYVSIAIPSTPRTVKGHAFAGVMLSNFGIGKIIVTEHDVITDIRPKLHRTDSHYNIKRYLHPEQKNSEAGTKNGGYWTPFKETTRSIESYLKRHPGATMKEIVESVGHHYASNASAKQSIALAISKGWMENIRKEVDTTDGKTHRFYLV